jgi:small subunit ribosomal protein S5
MSDELQTNSENLETIVVVDDSAAVAKPATRRAFSSNPQAASGGNQKSFQSGRGGAQGGPGGARFSKRDNRNGTGKRREFDKRGGDRNQRQDQEALDNKVIDVRRVTRVTKGGKKMRFSALVVVGDKAGRVGYAVRKGVDFQAAVQKATKKAQQTMIKIELTENGSIKFPVQVKFQNSRIFMKPAPSGTGLIAGGYLRPILELAGVQNIYSKIITSSSKITGIQAALKALEKFKTK